VELFDYLSDEDKITIKEFIQAYANIEEVDMYKALQYWNKNKRKMFKALGRNLRVKIPVDIPCDDKLFINALQDIYIPPFGYQIEGKVNHPFIPDFENFVINKVLQKIPDMWKQSDIKDKFMQMFRYDNFKSGVLNRDYSFVREGKRLKIPEGTKIMKAIRKMLVFAGYPNMDLFESFRNEISNLTTSKHIKTNLVFSIHPIDFLTMSDNSLGWHSCMSWMQNGGYSTGPIEMMNSNMVIIAYLESSKSFQFNMHNIPNKSWRVLLYVHKNILLAGKAYPYINDKITTEVLDKMRELLYNNLKWKYQYINQEYRDLLGYHSNDHLRGSCIPRNTKKNQHKIIIYTNGMYNDLVESHITTYWCCRNWVPKPLMLNASGIANCMLCGEPIVPQEEINCNYDSDLEIHGNVKVCPKCYRNCYCSCCKNFSFGKKYKIREWINVCHSDYCSYKWICPKCAKEYFFFYDDTNVLAFVHENNLSDWKKKNPNVHYERVGGNIEQLIDKNSIINAVQAA
jgi:hypothetical protein